MWEIAGVVISAVGLLSDLTGRYQDSANWSEADLVVDREWLGVAISKGTLVGYADEYRWSQRDRAATRELQGTYSVVRACDEHRRIKYRICRKDGTILMRKASAAAIL